MNIYAISQDVAMLHKDFKEYANIEAPISAEVLLLYFIILKCSKKFLFKKKNQIIIKKYIFKPKI